MEIWKDIPGYEGLYKASTLGRIKSLNYIRTKKENILSTYKPKNGYEHVNLRFNNKTIPHKVHSLIAKTFILNNNNKSEVNHKDRNKLNNNVNNLEWVTHKENMQNANPGSKGIKVCQYDLQGKFIKKWNKICIIEKELHIHKTAISACVRNKQKTAYGYIWKYDGLKY